jgi:hypothetical protein
LAASISGNALNDSCKEGHLSTFPLSKPAPTRLSPDVEHIATTYRLPVKAVHARSHREAYQTAVYLLRRAANEPLQTTAIRFHISPTRISRIQKAIEAAPRSPQQTRIFATCKVKN